MKFNEPNFEYEKDLAYDLRQIYANLLGEHLVDAAMARKNNSFFAWFKSLEDIKTITLHKWKDRKKSIETYNHFRNKIIDLSNKYPMAWLGKSFIPAEIAEIEGSLRELEEFLYEKMEDAKIFGEAYHTSGL